MPPPSPGTHVSSYASPHTWHTCILVCLPSVRACERANICAACERACVCVCPCEHACICACLHNCMCVCARALRACVCECLPASMHGCVRMCVRVTTGMSTCVAPPLTASTLMVVHPAWNRPDKPRVVSADLMTAPQKGATSSLQSAVLMPVKPRSSAVGMCKQCP